jgi:hypothetical protein
MSGIGVQAVGTLVGIRGTRHIGFINMIYGDHKS